VLKTYLINKQYSISILTYLHTQAVHEQLYRNIFYIFVQTLIYKYISYIHINILFIYHISRLTSVQLLHSYHLQHTNSHSLVEQMYNFYMYLVSSECTAISRNNINNFSKILTLVNLNFLSFHVLSELHASKTANAYREINSNKNNV